MKYRLWILSLCMMLALCAGACAESLSGCAYVDANENGQCDAGEQLITGVPLVLEPLTGEETVASVFTDEYGCYALDVPSDGEYRLRCTLAGQDLYAATLGESTQYENGFIVLENVQPGSGVDVGLRTAAKITVSTFQDADGNGKRGKYETGMRDVRVEVISGETVLAQGMTDKKGSVLLSAAPGEHQLRFTVPDGIGFTVAGEDSCAGYVGSDTTVSEALRFAAGETAEAFIGVRPVGSFSGKAWEDMNNNGVLDEDEPGVAGVTVYLEGERTGTTCALVTDETGLYHFANLPDDKYTITADIPAGMLYARYTPNGGDLRSIFTGDNLERQFSVKNAGDVVSKNIGVVQNGVIHGYAFMDLNYNGLWDEGEPGYEGVTVDAYRLNNNESMGKVVTDKEGAFRLENLRSGNYRVRAILPDDGSEFSITAAGAVHEVNLFDQRTNRRESSYEQLVLESGAEASVLIGVARGAVVSGSVFQDDDYNGHQNGKEKYFSGIRVRAVAADGSIAAEDTTGPKGQYELSGIMPGEYTIQVQRKAGMGFTRLRPNDKGGSHIAVLEGDWGKTDAMQIAMGDEFTQINAGMLPSSTVSGSFFHDVNDNGLWDQGELGMLSAKVRLLSADGEIDLYQTPADDGSYFFDGVMPGKYTLTYLLPEHCEMAQTASGGNTVKHNGPETTIASFQVKLAAAVELPLAGAVTLGNFEGVVFRDSNANGVMDAEESPLSGAEIVLTSTYGSAEATTGNDGAFSITDLRPAEYTLQFTTPDGTISSHSFDLFTTEAVSRQELSCPWQALINRESKQIGAVAPASIAGEIWMDENQDGVQGETEWIMEGLTLSLLDENGAVAAQTVTDAGGFVFENVRPGSYTVSFQMPEQSSPAQDAASTFSLAGGVMQQTDVKAYEGEAVHGLRTGLVSRTSIAGTAWLDEYGVRTPVAGVTVSLRLPDGQTQSVQTDENGAYRFDGLWPGDYSLSAQLPNSMIFVRPNDPNYAPGSSFADSIANDSASSRAFPLYMAQHQLSRDVLFIKPAKIGDIAWLDENQNGLVDGSERRLPGVTVQLVQDGAVIYETTTDSYGYYLFDGVYPGQYVLQASAWPQVSPTTPVEALRIISSCLTSGDGTNAQSDPFSILSGESSRNFDLGYILLDGQTLPQEALVEPEGRDWTIPNTPKED